MEEHKLRPKFLSIYANIPVGLRSDIIFVASGDVAKEAKLPDGAPLTWNACWLEVHNKTKLGNHILDTLGRLDII